MYSYNMERTKYYFCILEFEPFSESELTIYIFERGFRGAVLLVSKSVTFLKCWIPQGMGADTSRGGTKSSKGKPSLFGPIVHLVRRDCEFPSFKNKFNRK